MDSMDPIGPGKLGPLKQLRVYSWGYGFRGGGSFQTGLTVVELLAWMNAWNRVGDG